MTARGPQAWGAVRAVAVVEARRRWRSLLLLGLAVGVLGGAVAGSLVVARRTATAFDRLVAASALGDVRALAFDAELADRIVELPEVASSWTAHLAVARVEGGEGVIYTGWTLGPPPPPGLQEPVVVEGRAPDPDVVDEVLVTEGYAEELGLAPGDEVRFRFLAPEEVARFDTGFGEPDGPAVTVRVTGVVRLPSGVDQSPVLATPAFAARYGEEVGAGVVLAVRLRDGVSIAAFRASVDRLAETSAPTPGAEEFAPVEVTAPTGDRASVAASARVLVVGLALFAAVASVTGLVAVTQALVRHHDAGAGAQRVESALGLTAGERALARVAALVPTALAAGALTAAGALAAGLVEPLGAIARLEPVPGWAPNVALAVVGALVASAAVLVLGAATAWRAGAAPRSAGGVPTSRPRLTAVPLPPAAAVGIGFALAHPRAARSTPTRSSLAGAVLAVTGVVAALVFGASLQRLVDEPTRWGWHGDVVVVDATPAIVDGLLADERVAALSVIESTTLDVGGRTTNAYALTDRRSSAGWTVLRGRAPTADDEALVGTRVAERAGVDVGDRLTVGSGERLRVVGVGLGPVLVGEDLGDSIQLTPDGLRANGRTAAFTEAMVRARPGATDALVADLVDRYEVTVAAPPSAVADLGDLDRLPDVLGGFLALVGVAALAHALSGTVRRRSPDLAVLRVLGFSPGRTGRTLVAMAVTTTAVGLVAGLPLGLAVGRLAWWLVADANAVAADPALPAVALSAVVAGALVVALLAAALPARRAAATAPAALLRDA